jgi:hypothetical protein
MHRSIAASDPCFGARLNVRAAIDVARCRTRVDGARATRVEIDLRLRE